MEGLAFLPTAVHALRAGQDLTAVNVSWVNSVASVASCQQLLRTYTLFGVSVCFCLQHTEVCAIGAEPSCPTAALGLGPTTCGTCRQLLEHSYCESLDQVVANLNGLEPFVSLGIHSAFFEPQGFMRLLAFVETQDGLLLRDCSKGGIWNVDYRKLSSCLSRGSMLLYPYSAEYIFTVSLTDTFTYEDFNCPENSAFAALLLLICNSKPTNLWANPVTSAANLPTEPDSFPSFYASYYCHPDCNESEAEEKFMQGMQAFEGCSRRRQVVRPFTSNSAKRAVNADVRGMAEDSVFTAREFQHSAGVCVCERVCSHVISCDVRDHVMYEVM